MKFIALPVKNLANHRVRSGLTALGIAVAIAGFLSLVGLSRGLESSWVLSLQGKGTHIVALQKGSVELLTAALDEKLADRMRLEPGVAAVMGALGDLVELDTGQMAYLAGWPLDSDFWTTLTLETGTRPTLQEPDNVVLGDSLAKALEKKPGDTIRLDGLDFKISGVSKQASVLDDRSVMIPLAAMQRLVGREGKVSGFHIRLRHPDDAAEFARIQARLGQAFPNLSFIESSELGNNTYITRMLRAVAWASSSIALAMALVAVLNTLLMSVTERTREIGLLSAVGWAASRVMTMVVLEGLVLAGTGAAVGISLGLGLLRWITVNPKVGGLLQPEVTPELVVEAGCIALLLGALGGLYPAWRATRLNPMELLRSE